MRIALPERTKSRMSPLPDPAELFEPVTVYRRTNSECPRSFSRERFAFHANEQPLGQPLALRRRQLPHLLFESQHSCNHGFPPRWRQIDYKNSTRITRSLQRQDAAPACNGHDFTAGMLPTLRASRNDPRGLNRAELTHMTLTSVRVARPSGILSGMVVPTVIFGQFQLSFPAKPRRVPVPPARSRGSMPALRLQGSLLHLDSEKCDPARDGSKPEAHSLIRKATSFLFCLDSAEDPWSFSETNIESQTAREASCCQ